MKRIHLFELADQSWFPLPLRRQGMELLATIFRLSRSYETTDKILVVLMNECANRSLIVLAAGSGGGIIDMTQKLPNETRIVLTDIFPDVNLKFEDARISYDHRSVDATCVPADLHGVRVIYTAFHHFNPPIAKALIADAVRANEPIAIFEITERSFRGLAVILLLPMISLLVTPFVRPFNWSRLFWTYVVPVIPAFVFWDGFVSSLRTYSKTDLEPILRDFSTYEWTFKKFNGPNFEPLSALIGKPK